MIKVKFKVNGEEREIVTEPTKTLLEILRDDLGLRGTKEGCGKGECGACTVIMDGKPVVSCLVLACQLAGCQITTIEGLSRDGKLDPVQEAFIEEGAVQCGFCTPGMILSAKALLMGNQNPTDEEIKEAISGNLCRCTGYIKIIKAIQKAAKAQRAALAPNTSGGTRKKGDQ